MSTALGCVSAASLHGGADMSLVPRHRCCWSDFAEHSSTVPHSTCACIHVDLHVCSPCQSLPHSARLSGSSAQSLKMPDSARNSASIIRRPPGTCLGNLRKTEFGYHVCVCEQIHALGFHDRALYLEASGTL